MFPKDNFTFYATFVTKDDIHKLLERYKSAKFLEKSSISNDFIKLKDVGIIETQKNNDDK